jgi:hypothetical protein
VISFRYHIVSIVSVFLALAVGVALGGGPLKGTVDNTLVQQVHADRLTKRDLKGEVEALRTDNQFNDDFASTVAPGLLRGDLRGRVVTIVVMPTADPDVVASLRHLVGVAGGSVGGTMRIGPKMVDVSGKQLVDELGNQLETRTAGLDIPADAAPYDRMGALVARAIGTNCSSTVPAAATPAPGRAPARSSPLWCRRWTPGRPAWCWPDRWSRRRRTARSRRCATTWGPRRTSRPWTPSTAPLGRWSR